MRRLSGTNIVLANLIFFMISSLNATAQYEYGYLEGAVITNEYDTIWGKVMDRKDGPFRRFYRTIRFKPEKGRKRKYSPMKISGYIKGDQVFKSIWYGEESRFFKTTFHSRENFGKKYFMRVIKRGHLSHYILEVPDTESEYIDQVSLLKRNGEDRMIPVYRGIFGLNRKKLIEYFHDNPELQKKIETKEIDKIEEIVDFFNNGN